MSKPDYLKAERTVKELRELWPSYCEARSQSSCDKYGFGFNLDDRFAIAAIKLSLDTHTGYYGSSSCSCFGSVGDNSLFESAFVEYLNSHLPEILEEVAGIIEKASLADKAQYIARLEAELARVKGEEAQ